MRVITLAGSPRYPSRSSALLEYARETSPPPISKSATGICRTLPPKTSCTLALTTRRYKRSMSNWPGPTV